MLSAKLWSSLVFGVHFQVLPQIWHARPASALPSPLPVSLSPHVILCGTIHSKIFLDGTHTTLFWHLKLRKRNLMQERTLDTRFGSVLGFASKVRFYHGFLNGLLMTFLGYETTQWNAWLIWKVLEISYILAPWALSLRPEGF